MSFHLTPHLCPADHSAGSFDRWRERRNDFDLLTYSERTCNQLLDADKLDRPLLADLANSRFYSHAFSALTKAASASDFLIESLLSPPLRSIAPFRFARIFGLCSGEPNQPFTLSTLRQLSSDAATCALACIETISWPDASRRARALLLLRLLVEEARGS